MSYSIDFHYGNLTMPVEHNLSYVHHILCEAGFAFLAYCHELELDEEGEVDTVFPEIKIRTLEEAAAISKNWNGRVHYYRWQTQFDLAVYSWCKPPNALILSMDYREWRHLLENRHSIEQIVSILCTISHAVGSPCGYSKVNSEFVPLNFSTSKVLELISEGNPEPQVFWSTETQLSYQTLKTNARKRLIIPSTSGYIAAVTY